MTILAGVINQEQQRVIEYLRTENQVLKEKLGKKRILLNDDQRRRLVAKGKALGRETVRLTSLVEVQRVFGDNGGSISAEVAVHHRPRRVEVSRRPGRSRLTHWILLKSKKCNCFYVG